MFNYHELNLIIETERTWLVDYLHDTDIFFSRLIYQLNKIDNMTSVSFNCDPRCAGYCLLSYQLPTVKWTTRRRHEEMVMLLDQDMSGITCN